MAPPFASTIVGRGRYLRPTSARQSERFGGGNIGIEILGLRDAERIPEQLSASYQIMLERLRVELEQKARDVVPGGPGGTLGRQVHAHRIRNRILIGTVGSEFAAALDRGFTAPSKRFNQGKPTGRSLRGFSHQGKTVYTRKIHVAGRHFYEKWLALTGPLVQRIYASSFHDITDRV